MSPFNRRGDIITRHGKKKNDKDETGNILAKIRYEQFQKNLLSFSFIIKSSIYAVFHCVTGYLFYFCS
jgi:hypothetical protein